jgi:flavorubredoxin
MEVIVTYDSYFYNTRKLAEVVAESIEAHGASAYLERIYQFDFSDMNYPNLFIIGLPTHIQGMPRPVKSVLKRLPKDTFKGISTAAFDTRYQMPSRKSGSAAKRVVKKLNRLGGREIAPPESFYVIERCGPLFEGEIERAKTWAISLLEKINQESGN